MNIIRRILLLTLVPIAVSCYFESDDVLFDETTESYELYDYYVDDNGNEGVVAYVSDDKIIVISADESVESWGPMEELVYNTDSFYYSMIVKDYYPLAMLQCMTARGIDRYPAQAWCNKKNGSAKYPYGGSWMLPSRQLMRFVFGEEGIGVSKLNKALLSFGMTPISKDEYYWTCVEDYDGVVTFSDGTETDYDPQNRAVMLSPMNVTSGNKDRWLKKNTHRVRAVKFIYKK